MNKEEFFFRLGELCYYLLHNLGFNDDNELFRHTLFLCSLCLIMDIIIIIAYFYL